MKRAANLINKSGLEEREMVVEDSMVGHFLHAAFSILAKIGGFAAIFARSGSPKKKSLLKMFLSQFVQFSESPNRRALQIPFKF